MGNKLLRMRKDVSKLLLFGWIDLVGRKAIVCLLVCFNLIPHMPILGSSNSVADKDMMAKIWTNGDKII